MWPQGRCDYARPPSGPAPGRSHPAGGCQGVTTTVPRKPPLLDSPGEGSHSRSYSHAGSRVCDEDRSFSDGKSGPPHGGHDSPCGWPGWGQPQHGKRRTLLPLPPLPLRQQAPSFTRDRKDGSRRTSIHSSHGGRGRCRHKRDAPLLRHCPVGRRDSAHSVSSRNCSPERNKAHSLQQHPSQEAPVQSLQTSRDTSPPSRAVVPSSKAPATAPLLTEQPEAPESSAPQGVEFFEFSQLSARSKAIAMKTREIEQVYRQDCETFGLVVKMLVEKDPSLAKAIQPALRQNLHELGERCVGELKRFIAEYDTATPALGEPL